MRKNKQIQDKSSLFKLMFAEYIDKNSNHEVKETQKKKLQYCKSQNLPPAENEDCGHTVDHISIRNCVLYTRQVDYGQS